MILFIIIAICILIYTTFAEDFLIDCVEQGDSVLESLGLWFLWNVILNILNWFVVFFVSVGMIVVLNNTHPMEVSEWEFNINALQDSVVTEGRLYGRRGYVNGELSYFYSRPFIYGEKIEHIPANKTYIAYNDDEHPHVEVHEKRIDIPEWMYKVFFLEMMNEKTTDYYVIVVPEGTIVNADQYEIDMK